MNTQKRFGLIMRSGFLVIVTALCIAACAGPAVQVPVPAQVTEKLTNKDVLQACAVLGDQDMAEIRGCYDATYYFGLDFVGTIDMASLTKKIEGSVSAYAAVMNGNPLPMNFNGTGISFEAGNGQVAFHSSIGKSPLGTGVIQLVQVAGNNNLVIANTNVTLNIQNFQTIKPNVATALGALRR